MSSKYSYIISKQANNDIESTLKYINDNLCNPKAASDLFTEIEKTINIACEFPLSFPTSEYYYIQDQNVRHTIIGNYVLFYEIRDSENRLEILRFRFSGINFKANK